MRGGYGRSAPVAYNPGDCTAHLAETPAADPTYRHDEGMPVSPDAVRAAMQPIVDLDAGASTAANGPRLRVGDVMRSALTATGDLIETLAAYGAF